MTQTVLPFKLDQTKDTLTAHAGLALVGEYMAALNLEKLTNKHLPASKSAIGYAPSAYIQPLILMLLGGGQTIADMRVIRNDVGLNKLLGFGDIPSESSIGDWLKRQGDGEGLNGLGAMQKEVLSVALKKEVCNNFTLDIDATQIIAHKFNASTTYKGEKGYMPIVGHIAENGLVVGDDFRSGNTTPSTRNLEFIQYCEMQLPKNKKFTAVRADSASYQADIFNHCESNQQEFAIGAVKNEAVKKDILAIPESAWTRYRDREIAETIHSMEGTKKAFRLIVTRKPRQTDLFKKGEEAYFFHAIASNKTGTAKEVKDWYCQRGETSENNIKELKLGVGMDRMPSGEEKANALFFRIGILAYNISLMFKIDTLPEHWQRHQLKTLRWQLFHIAGKIVKRSRYLKLKIKECHHILFEQIRILIWQRKCQLE